MKTTERGLGWELKKSIHLILLALFPIINCFAYFLMNKNVKQKRWSKHVFDIYFSSNTYIGNL